MQKAYLETIVENYWKFDQLLFDWVKEKTGSTFAFTQFITLQFLITRGPQALKTIAQTLSITAASTSTMIKKMENEGLVTRTEDLKDRRINLIQITQKGKKQHKIHIGTMEEFFDKYIPENERQAYLRIIQTALGEDRDK